jgi:UV DNA damage endonuclease
MNRLGLCCLVLGEEKSNFRTLQLNRTKAETNKEEKVFEVYKHNLNELVRVLRYLMRNNIEHYRISSNMFPLADHPDFQYLWDKFCDNEICWRLAKTTIKEYLDKNNRLSTHPDQFCLISSKDDQTNVNGIRNLEYHAKMFDMLDIPQSYFCPINIHVSNGTNGSISGEISNRNLDKLSSSVRSRLVFETEDKSYWTYQNLYTHFKDVPITLDYHHRLINNMGESEQEAHDFCVTTWRSFTPLFHHSEGKSTPLDRAHSDYITKLPDCAVNVDVEIEAKQKNLAIFRLKGEK